MNKSDRPGADTAITSIQSILNFKPHDEYSWLSYIIKSIAVENVGIKEIYEAIEKHKNYLEVNGLLQKKREHNSKIRIKEIVESQIKAELWTPEREISLNESLERVVLGIISPYTLAEELINHYKNENGAE